MNLFNDIEYLNKIEEIKYTDNHIKLLFNIFNNSKFIGIINKKFVYNNNYIKHFYIKNEFYETLKLKYDLIDLYFKNLDLEDIKFKIKEIYKNININLYNDLWSISKNYDFCENIDEINIYNNDLFLYKYHVLNLKFNKKKFFFFNKNDINLIFKELIILYYDDLYKNNNDLVIEDDKNYNRFVYLVTMFNDIYNDGKFYKKLSLIEDIEYNKTNINKNNWFINFLYFCINNRIVNKNLIIWVYIICNKIIEDDIINEYFLIIINNKEKSLGFIEEILKYYDKDYLYLDKEKIEKYLDMISDEEIFGKIKKELKLNIDIKTIFNNIEFLKKIDNKNSDMRYDFLKNFDIEKVDKKYFFVFFMLDPLEINIDIFKLELLEIKNKIKKIKYNEKDFIKIINTLMFFNNRDKDNFECIYIDNKDIDIKILNYEKVKNFFLNIIEKNFDIQLIFDKIVKFFGNYEIILDKNFNIDIILKRYFKNNI